MKIFAENGLMLKADLHVHSKYSSNPADLLLKKFGTRESYTGIEEVYARARACGMDLVTITDHNTIGGVEELVAQYPDEAFYGVELTTCFPEDGCAVHLLVFDFTPRQFAEMDRLRADIYKLRDYIKKEGLPYSVAHPTYSVNGRLSVSVVEKLILLFDVFECINGTRAETGNNLAKRILQSLTPERIEELKGVYGIAPISDTPWIKSFTGGSDEHAGLFIGETCTTAGGKTKEDFLRALREKKTDGHGRSNHYKTQVYTFLKIAYHYSRTRKGGRGKRAWDEFGAAIFEGKNLSWKTRLKVEQMKRSRKGKARVIATQLSLMIRRLAQDETLNHRGRIDLIYETVAGLEDEFFISNFKSFRDGFLKGDPVKIMSSITAVFRSLFLSLPFLGTFRHLHQSSALMERLRLKFLGPLKPEEKKILWFSDTIHDLNGVSVTLRNFACRTAEKGLKIRIVTPQEDPARPFPHQIKLPTVYEYVPDFYPTYKLRIPSLLKSLEIIYDEKPTEIVVSTPGPVGMVGVLAARLFGIPCRSIYHSNFTRMTELGLSGGSIVSFVQGYIRLFYSWADEIRVPTNEVIRLLVLRGYDPARLTLFKRGIDMNVFAPVGKDRAALRREIGVDDHFTLLYTGRVSRDKSLGFLAEICKELAKRGEEVNLLVVGDGPMLAEMKKQMAHYPRVRFMGRMEEAALPAFYSMADLFVFPSTMDTFGMAVLEAQACGLPVVVTNVGGPQEIIEPGRTGFVIPADDVAAWVGAILQSRAMMREEPARWQEMKTSARKRVEMFFSWDEAIEDIFQDKRSVKTVTDALLPEKRGR